MIDLRSAAARHDQILGQRLDELVPRVMERAGIDAWVLTAREYNEDPVLQTMLPAVWLGTARRRTILLFLDRGAERHAVARYDTGSFPAAWDPATHPDQWSRVAELLDEADPARIGINTSAVFPLADGLVATELSALEQALPARLRHRLHGAEVAAIGWLETRLPQEITVMGEACGQSHEFLRRALSREAITPGVTTTTDVEWWLRSRVAESGLDVWFQPTVSLQRRGGSPRSSFADRPSEVVIETGDLVHIDFGIRWDGYCTDQQQHAYVLRGRELEAPAGLVAGLAAANRLQELLLASFETGSTGNEILRRTRDAAAAEAIDGLVYTHPIGVHGHAAGPTIGLWDSQEGVAGQGDYPLWPDTAYSIELQARTAIAEWEGQVVQFMLEEDAFFDGVGMNWLHGRQTSFHLI